ncbi:MAG: hypothetical protein LBH49_00695, partial [Puniceicoccales bacterium]|nr:hypothetical protein [Puniceicoccales bacterium]
MIISKIIQIIYLIVNKLEEVTGILLKRLLIASLAAIKLTIPLVGKVVKYIGHLGKQLLMNLLSFLKSIFKFILNITIKISKNAKPFATFLIKQLYELFRKYIRLASIFLSNISRLLVEVTATAIYFFVVQLEKILSKSFHMARNCSPLLLKALASTISPVVIYFKKIFFYSSVAGRKFFSYCFNICKNFVDLLAKISAKTLATLIIYYK